MGILSLKLPGQCASQYYSVGGGKCHGWSCRPPIGMQLSMGAHLGRIHVGFAWIGSRAAGSVLGAAALCWDDCVALGCAHALVL